MMKTVCSKGQTTPVIDVSHYEPHEDWALVKASGIHAMYAKSSEGVGIIDATYHDHVTQAKAAGLLTGAYHFFHDGVDPVKQANLFVRMLKSAPFDLPPVLDWETHDTNAIATNLKSALTFLSIIEKETGMVPMIYSGPYFLLSLKLSPDFARYPLWISHYGVRCPMVPPPWSDWAFWQSTDKFQLAKGIYVDAGIYNGSLDQLQGMKWISPA